MVLISYNTFRKIFPSLETISKDSGIKSITDISKKLHTLEKYGYISIIRRKHLSNIYKINSIEMKNPVDPEPQKAEKEILKAYIERIAYVIAGYRNINIDSNEKKKQQIFAFINNYVYGFKDKTVKHYQVAFMFLCYVLRNENKFCAKLPYNYFNTFFIDKLKYSDFRNEIFSSDNYINLINNIG
jgi:hypothetical protein